MNKLFQRIKSEIPVGSLGNYATMLVVIGITISIAALILTTIGADSNIGSATGVANTTINSGISALGTFGDWLVIIAIVIVAVVVLSLIKYL
jgi:hypothetical protein